MLVLGEFLAYLEEKMAFIWMAGMFVPAIFFLIKSKTKVKLFLFLPLVGMVGAGCYLAADQPDCLQIPYQQEINQCHVTVEGVITKIETKKAGIRVFIKPATVIWGDFQYYNQGIIWDCNNDAELHLESKIRLSGKLSAFSHATNPGEFDAYQYYRALGYPYRIQTKDFTLLERKKVSLKDWLYQKRREWGWRIEQNTDSSVHGLLRAVLLGEAKLVPEDTKELYQEMGIAHILAVSGMHLSVIGMSIYTVIRRVSGSYAVAGIAGGLVTVGYGMMIGNPLSVKRAILMYCISAYGRYRGRTPDTVSALSAAVLFTAIENPLCIIQASFQLSFSAVIGIALIGDGLQAFLLKEKKSAFLNTIGMQFAMLPVLLSAYGQYPLYSMLLNLLIIPSAPFLLIAAGACGINGVVGAGAGKLAGMLLRGYDWFLINNKRLPGNQLTTGKPTTWKIILYISLLLLFLIFSKYYQIMQRKEYYVIRRKNFTRTEKRKRTVFVYAACIIAFLISLICLRADRVKELTITMLDIGQGDAVLIEVPQGGVYLSDAGSTSKASIASYTLEPVLLAKGIDVLEGVFVSHADADHMNGIQELIERDTIKIGFLAIPGAYGWKETFKELIAAAEKRKIPIIPMASGDCLDGEVIQFEIMHPQKEQRYADQNDTSLVIHLTYQKFHMLFTGDISCEQEDCFGEDIDVLKLAHHGSRYSTSQEWLRQITPAVALISCGENNKYGHPHKEVISRLEEEHIDWYQTSVCGAITVQTDGEQFTVTCSR